MLGIEGENENRVLKFFCLFFWSHFSVTAEKLRGRLRNTWGVCVCVVEHGELIAL